MNLDQISPIIPNIYISNWTASADFNKLRDSQIRAILTVERRSKDSYTLSLYEQNEIDFLQIPIDDDPSVNISIHFDPTFDFINNHVMKGENVLIHCYAGISRSVSIVLNYLIRRLYIKAKDANAFIGPETALAKSLDLIQKSRPVANPNKGFMVQLLDKAREYAKTTNQRELNYRSSNDKPVSMCEKNFLDASGKPANIICLENSDFDQQGNLTNFANIDGVIFFFSNSCGHCVNTKPEFIKFSNMIGGTPVRAFSVDGAKERELLMRLNPKVWGYAVRGFPTIVGYSKGKFYSEYGYDTTNPSAFRKAEDFLEYSKGLGSAQVHAE